MTDREAAAVTEDGTEIRLYLLDHDVTPGERHSILLAGDDIGGLGQTHWHLSEVDALKLAHGILGLLHETAERAENARIDAILKRYNDAVAKRAESGNE